MIGAAPFPVQSGYTGEFTGDYMGGCIGDYLGEYMDGCICDDIGDYIGALLRRRWRHSLTC